MRPHHQITKLLIALTLSLWLAAPAQEAHQGHDQEPEAVPADAPVPLFEGLGDHHFPITTSSAEAQRYFDQGLIFTYGFNHFEAVRSFEEAARIDPDCAMCYWGIALALGPHINAPMFPEAVAPAYEALSRAQELALQATERELAYITALSERYVADASEDRSHLDRAYADAMRELVAQYLDDLDAKTLFAESLMNLVPWNYWTEAGEPRPETAELALVLESVLANDPYHPGATHYYIHVMEDSPYPERAEAAADNLTELNIGIGHMIHMPSHIYARVGRWHDATVANQLAVQADRAYLDAYAVEGLIPLLYHPHNYHFLSWTAGMEGRAELAIEAARQLVAATPAELAQQLPFLNGFLTMPTLTLVRFEMWDDILEKAPPAAESLFETAIWHYARARALAANGQLDEAREEAARLAEIAASDEAQALEVPEAFLPGASIIAIADTIVQADVALAEGHGGEAIELLERAVAMQDALPYFEPPYWFTSARLDLGNALLLLERPEEAAEVYRADLEEYPNNGWALFGLAESLRAQGKMDEALEVQQRFEVAWQHADAPLASER